jgi:hypothetical protein
MSNTIRICFLEELPVALQTRYFQVRSRLYVSRWSHRFELPEGFAERDIFDEDYVIAAVDAGQRIVGGARANVVRPGGSGPVRKLPMEAAWGFSCQALFPEHPLDRLTYGEASKLFVCLDNLGESQALAARIIDFLLGRIPGVDIAYFGLPENLLRGYRLLAKIKGIPHKYKRLKDSPFPPELQAFMAPWDRVSTDGKSLPWGVFACELVRMPKKPSSTPYGSINPTPRDNHG